MLTTLIRYFRDEATRLTLTFLGVCLCTLIVGYGTVAVLNSKASAQPSDEIPVWVYPSGVAFPHPEIPGVLCVLAKGHPTRDTEAHCAPIPVTPASAARDTSI